MMAAMIFQATGSSGFGGFLIPLGLMFAIMYFMVIMPQQRQRKKTQEMLGALKAGDKIITNGAIDAAVGDDLITGLESAEHFLGFLALALLGHDHHEIHDGEHETERDQETAEATAARSLKNHCCHHRVLNRSLVLSS